MSDLAAAAAAVGGPEDLVMRSARARAEATGVPVEEVLAAWAGGGSAPAATAAPATPAPAEAELEEQLSPTPPAGAVVDEMPRTEPPDMATPATAGPVVVVDQRKGAAPLLTGRTDRPMLYLAGIALLFIIGAVGAVALPARDAQAVAADQIPGTTPILSELGEEGRQVYMQEGCFYCHTQQVRTVVTDVGLGTVTEPGTSPALPGDTFGYQRLGPDLTHVGSREPTNDAAFLRTYLRDPLGVVDRSDHASFAYLSDADLDSLVQYLMESQ